MKRILFFVISTFFALSLSAQMPDLPEILEEQLIQEHFDLTYNEQVQEQENTDRKSTRLNSSHIPLSRMPSSA